jgi:hypothetical protein
MMTAIIAAEIMDASRMRIPVMIKEMVRMWLNTTSSRGALSIPPKLSMQRIIIREDHQNIVNITTFLFQA